ncbi:hypothetical protein B0H16DRAFT_1589666 [Mycena metata]|uniref:Uncharacterized protein n=1 Tax=Mycena metata TaxID=1033252 RepID=A0AAD7HTD5_9AGAR|nr:hypothetical protein B0H16DRAFT_1589666 [Mycena metata]
MRCLWSPTASNAFQIFASRPASFSGGRAGFSRLASRSTSLLKFPTAIRVSTTSAALSYTHVVSKPMSLGEAVDAVPESSTSLPNLAKPSRISFAAAQAIRMCIKNGGIADGFFVLNSIRYAAYRQKASSLPFKMPGMLYSRIEFEAAALQFGPHVSQRLSAHVLLHGLIRNNLAEPAFELAKMLMAEGLVIRGRTMEGIIEALVYTNVSHHPKNPTLRFVAPHPSIPLRRARDVLVLRPAIMADQRTRFALQLLFLARRHRQRRTDNMFKLLMAASLLNGELIIFSLLFGWACRDWQKAYSIATNLEAIPEDDELHSSSQVMAARHRLDHLRTEGIFPGRHSMESALTIIETILTRDIGTPEPTHTRLVALQALGNLAGLLDRREIPFPEIEALLRTMYKCPRVEDEIWIVGASGCPERIKAYTYFHRILLKLIRTLPSDRLFLRHPPVARDAIVHSRRYDMLPPLKLEGYNGLLHYALRHRLSPAHGQAILSHMMKKRWEPISPDIVTANILIRSGTVMRRYDIVEEVLRSIGTDGTYISAIPTTPLPGSADPPTETNIALDSVEAVQLRTDIIVNRTKWGKKLAGIGSETIEVPQLPSDVDIYTLTSYIAYLASRGQPQAVEKLLFSVLPELDSTKYPTNSEQKKDRYLGRAALDATLRRSITLGPVFFTAVLNALWKAGKVVLADRVWQLAKKAEQRSWLRDLVPECKPWILDAAAHTIMMNCYGYLARRRLPWTLTLPRHRISQRTARHSVWATFLYECQKLLKPLSTAEVQALLHRYMITAALGVFRRLVGLARTHEEVPELRRWLPKEDIPKPDARFFNAALRVFRPRMPPMRKSWHRLQLRNAKFALSFKGVIPDAPGWNAPLHEVADCMVRMGYPIPYGLRHLFVGRLEKVDPPLLHRADQKPFAYGKYKYHSRLRYRLPTPKQRGLPVRRSYVELRKVIAGRRWRKLREKQKAKAEEMKSERTPVHRAFLAGRWTKRKRKQQIKARRIRMRLRAGANNA